MTTPLRPRTDLRTRLRLWAVSHDVESFDVDPHGKLMTSEAVVDELLAAIVADETDAERVARYGREQREAELANAALAAPAADGLDVERLPNGARLILQRGDDWGGHANEWLAVVENTVDLPDADTGRLGVGRTPNEAIGKAAAAYLREPSREPGEEG